MRERVETPEITADPDPAGAGVDPTRIDPTRTAGISDLRGHTARGTLINSAYQIMLSGLGLLQRLIGAAFLTTTEFGLWAVILTIVINMAWLKDLGIRDKYIQQSEPDQEAAFQKAFTLSLATSIIFFVLFILVLPLWALAYGQEEIIIGGLITALVVPLQALQFPALIPYRRLQYGRQRVLTGVTPVVMFIVTVALAIAGAGYWAFVIGAVAGTLAGSVVCTLTCPVPIRLRIDRGTVREYVSFSWPLAAAGLTGLLLVQGSLLIANATVGLAGVGAIGLVIGITAFTDRVDTVVSQTIYPAVCAVVQRMKLLEEVFVKSNRAALMWAIPFAVGVALFAGDLITFVLGEKWRLAEDLLMVTALSAGIGHLGFNWILFMRALNRTKPIFIASALTLITFLGVAAPAMSEFGLAGYGAALVATTAVQLLLRAYYMGKTFDGFAPLRHASRAIIPALPPATLILLIRFIAPGDRTLGRALAELAIYLFATALSTWIFERKLVLELTGYLRRARTSGRAAVASA